MTPFHPPAPRRASTRAQLESLALRQWIIQPKYNGVRVLLWRSATDSGVWTRHRTPLTKPSPVLTDRAAKLPVGTVVDGEWVTGQGLYLFDVAMVQGAVCKLPLVERLNLLSAFGPTVKAEDVWSTAPQIEGVVAKPAASLYVAGYSAPASCGWLKWRYEWET